MNLYRIILLISHCHEKFQYFSIKIYKFIIFCCFVLGLWLFWFICCYVFCEIVGGYWGLGLELVFLIGLFWCSMNTWTMGMLNLTISLACNSFFYLNLKTMKNSLKNIHIWFRSKHCFKKICIIIGKNDKFFRAIFSKSIEFLCGVGVS